MEIQDKKSALCELRYELMMFNETSKHLTKLLKHKENRIERCTYLESFLLHTRNIIDFLEKKKIKKDDITCSDFGISAVSVSLPSNNTRTEINKYLTHITKQRIHKKSPDWKYLEIKKEVHKHLKKFIEQLPTDYFCQNGWGSKSDFESLFN